jgi:hypothetical protein
MLSTSIERVAPEASRDGPSWSTKLVNFFTLGVLNNITYVIMIAGSPEIAAESIGAFVGLDRGSPSRGSRISQPPARRRSLARQASSTFAPWRQRSSSSGRRSTGSTVCRMRAGCRRVPC